MVEVETVEEVVVMGEVKEVKTEVVEKVVNKEVVVMEVVT